jgi:hypothetical protein
MKNAYNAKPKYFYVILWPCIHLPKRVEGSVARLPHFAQAAGTHFELETG